MGLTLANLVPRHPSWNGSPPIPDVPVRRQRPMVACRIDLIAPVHCVGTDEDGAWMITRARTNRSCPPGRS